MSVWDEYIPRSDRIDDEDWMSWMKSNDGKNELTGPPQLVVPSAASPSRGCSAASGIGGVSGTPAGTSAGGDPIGSFYLGFYDQNCSILDTQSTLFANPGTASGSTSLVQVSNAPSPHTIQLSSAGPSPHDVDLSGFMDPTLASAIPPAAFVPPPPWPRYRSAQNNSNKEQEQMLVALRQAGKGFDEIAEEMRTKLGVKVSPNALVKRYQKILDSFLLPVAEATKRAMPAVMAIIMRELNKETDGGELSEAEMKALEGLQQDLPRIVQNRVLRRRKAMLPIEE